MATAKVKDIKINYNTMGEGKPLTFIAGLGIDKTTWIYQIPFFQKHFKVIVFDNRGIGKSTSSFGPYTIEQMAEDTIELLKQLNIKKTHIVASSMGGMIAQEIAINHPELVDKLVLSSTSAKPENNVKEIISEGVREIIGHQVENIFTLNPRRIMFEKLFNFFLQQIFTKEFLKENKKMIEEELRKYLSDIKYVETFLKQTRAIHNHDTLGKLDSIKADTLIITGTDDKLLSQKSSEILAKKIPHSKLLKIKDAGHGFHIEKAEIFNKMILDFLKE